MVKLIIQRNCPLTEAIPAVLDVLSAEEAITRYVEKCLMQCASCENRVPCAPCREQLDPHERLTLALLSGVDLGNWRGNGWTRDRIYHALGKRQLQRHTRTQDAFGALVAVRIWPDDEVAGLSVDAPLPYNTSTLLPDLVQLLLKVLLAEEYAGDDQPWDTDDMVYYPNDMAVSDHDS